MGRNYHGGRVLLDKSVLIEERGGSAECDRRQQRNRDELCGERHVDGYTQASLPLDPTQCYLDFPLLDSQDFWPISMVQDRLIVVGHYISY